MAGRQGRCAFTAHLKGMHALAASENRDILLDYYEISRKRRTNRTALFKLQSHLFDDLRELENGNKLWKMKVEDCCIGDTAIEERDGCIQFSALPPVKVPGLEKSNTRSLRSTHTLMTARVR